MSDSIITFNSIYISYHKKAYLFAKSYVQDDFAAEDIASDSFIRLWERMKADPVDKEHIAPLLLTILKNKALDYLKHEEVKRQAFENITDWHKKELSTRISTLEACDPEEIFSDEVRRIVGETLAGLSEQTRRVFVLSRFEGKSNMEIADEIGISVKGVEYHISKALKGLRVALKDYLVLFAFFFVY